MCPLFSAWLRRDFSFKNGICSGTMYNKQRPRRRTNATVISKRYTVMFVYCRGKTVQYALVTAVVYVSDWNSRVYGSGTSKYGHNFRLNARIEGWMQAIPKPCAAAPRCRTFQNIDFSFNLCVLFFQTATTFGQTAINFNNW